MASQAVDDHVQIAGLCARIGWHLDHCQWDELPDLFTDEVALDYTSLNGGEPVTVPRKAMVQKWRENREGLAATQHLISNQLVP